MASLSCFFGAELKPDGMPFTPVIPPQSSLVITQCAVTAAVPSAPAAGDEKGTAGASSSRSSAGPTDTTTTTNADAATATTAMPATFSAVTLYVQSSEVPSRLAVCTLSPGQQLYYCPLQLIFGKQVTFTLLPQHKPLRAGAPVAYPTVHLTGYYEKEEEDPEGMEDDEADMGEAYLGGSGGEEEDDDELDGTSEEEQDMYTRGGGRRQPRPPSRHGGSRRPARH